MFMEVKIPFVGLLIISSQSESDSDMFWTKKKHYKKCNHIITHGNQEHKNIIWIKTCSSKKTKLRTFLKNLKNHERQKKMLNNLNSWQLSWETQRTEKKITNKKWKTSK